MDIAQTRSHTLLRCCSGMSLASSRTTLCACALAGYLLPAMMDADRYECEQGTRSNRVPGLGAESRSGYGPCGAVGHGRNFTRPDLNEQLSSTSRPVSMASKLYDLDDMQLFARRPSTRAPDVDDRLTPLHRPLAHFWLRVVMKQISSGVTGHICHLSSEVGAAIATPSR